MSSTLRARVLSWPGIAALAAVLVVAGLVIARAAGGDDDLTAADRSFAAVCRDHGGDPSFAPGSGDYVKDARSCEIEFGGERYEMYAVHPEGFSEREAAQAKRSCVVRARQSRRDAEATGKPAARVVWHPRSAICESRR
jgi:hypothetical protein